MQIPGLWLEHLSGGSGPGPKGYSLREPPFRNTAFVWHRVDMPRDPRTPTGTQGTLECGSVYSEHRNLPLRGGHWSWTSIRCGSVGVRGGEGREAPKPEGTNPPQPHHATTGRGHREPQQGSLHPNYANSS